MGIENEPTTDQRVSFTVKELLNRIDGKLDTMALAISAKADSIAFERLTARVETLEATDKSNRALGEMYLTEYGQLKADVRSLKEGSISSNSLDRYKRWLIATSLAAVAALGGLTAILLHIHF